MGEKERNEKIETIEKKLKVLKNECRNLPWGTPEYETRYKEQLTLINTLLELRRAEAAQ